MFTCKILVLLWAITITMGLMLQLTANCKLEMFIEHLRGDLPHAERLQDRVQLPSHRAISATMHIEHVLSHTCILCSTVWLYVSKVWEDQLLNFRL